jgi:radical SAM superfamily enzyme YgiQ (UPF0313 family)
MKNILLVKPPEKSKFNFGTYSLGVLAAVVRDIAGVSIYDATDRDPDEAVDFIMSCKPDIIGVTAMGFPSVKPVGNLISRIGRKTAASQGKSVMVVAGGHGATMAYAELLKAGADAVVLGEGELTFRSLVREGIQPGSAGIVCMSGRDVVVGPKQQLIQPLDVLQPPARDLMPMPPDGVYLMETSRGCPHSCNFCETTRFYGKTWRPYSPDRVVSEIKRLVDDYEAWIVHFADDNFAANHWRALEICRKLRSIQLPAFIMASARADDLVECPELIPAMAQANILRVSVGVETLDPGSSEIINKKIGIKTYQEAFRRMREHGIFSVASFIIGIPGEKREARSRALELAISSGCDSAHFLPFLPFPGIPLQPDNGAYKTSPQDTRDANRYSSQFMQNEVARLRLREAVAKGGIRGMLADATLRRSLNLCK